jgi:hypothetical protein
MKLAAFAKADKIGLDWFCRFTKNWLVTIQKIRICFFLKKQKLANSSDNLKKLSDKLVKLVGLPFSFKI